MSFFLFVEFLGICEKIIISSYDDPLCCDSMRKIQHWLLKGSSSVFLQELEPQPQATLEAQVLDELHPVEGPELSRVTAPQTLSDASQNPDYSQKFSNIDANAESVPGWRGLSLVFDF